MRQHIGFLCQLAVLALLPAIVVWQLYFGIPLVVMPASVVVGVAVFWIGYRLREG